MWREPAVLLAILVVIVGLGVPGGSTLFRYLRKRNRRRALQGLAAQVGLEYVERGDAYPRFALYRRFVYTQGTRPEARNILAGTCEGHEVLVFDYERKWPEPVVWFSEFVLALDAVLPKLLIEPHRRLKDLNELRFADIDLESVEFSDAFRVRSQDRRLAYDVCHPRMMECLLRHPDATVMILDDHLHLVFPRRLTAAEIPEGLKHLAEIRKLVPERLLRDWEEVCHRADRHGWFQGWFEDYE